MRTAMHQRRRLTLFLLIASLPAAAQEAVAPATETAVAQPSPAEPPKAAPAKPPYDLPWQLRPLAPGNVVRLDNSFDAYSTGVANALMLTGAYTFDKRLMALARVGMVFNAPASGAGAAGSFLNVLLGAQYLYAVDDFKLGAFLGVTLPTAGGGGDTPNLLQKTADGVGIYARSSMDNAMFAANDLTVIPGIGAAWVRYGLTVQLEATVLELIRVKGAAVQPDAAKTNFTSGLHVGYFIVPQFSVGADVRYQRWLTTPAAVAKDESLRQNLNGAIGVRAHFKIGALTFRPGISVSHGLVGSMTTANHTAVQLDVPVVF